MPGLTRIRTIAAALLLVATVTAITMTSTSGDGEEEARTLPTISISATGGTVSVEEGTDISFTITADSAPTADFELKVTIRATGKFTNIPTESDEYIFVNPEKVMHVTITAGSTQAELVIPTNDDAVDEENGSVEASLVRSSSHTVDADSNRATVQVLDNDPTLPPEKMTTPTVLPANGRLEIFWEEPGHTGEREIDRYRVTWVASRASGTITVRGNERHQSLTGLANGESHAVQIQACKEVLTYCSELSDTVSATPTASGPTITGPQTAVLPEEAAGTVGQYTATPSTGGTIAWRLGGQDAKFFSHTVNDAGNITLTLNEGFNFDDPNVRNPNNTPKVTVVATDSAPGHASNVIETTVTVTDVDETPIFSPNSITKGPYVAGERIEKFLLPTPKADEVPITYRTTNLPTGLSRYGTRLIQGIPTEPGTHIAEYRATDADEDWGELTIKFIVVQPIPTVTITAQHSERIEGQALRFTLTANPPPSQATEVKICVSQGTGDYLTDSTPSPECDPPGPVDQTTNRVLAKIGFPPGSSSEELILQTSDDTTGEGDATITATILRLSGDPYTAGAERVATTVIKDNDRVELDITPQPLRKTLLTWSAPTGTADGYFIQYREVGQAFSTSRQHDHGTLREYEINLDQIHQVTNSEGQMQWRALGDADYEFRVTPYATDYAGTKVPEAFSKPARLVENPLLQTGGRIYSPSNRGVATLDWNSQPGVIGDEYTIVYRSLGGEHQSNGWPWKTGWPNYGTPQTKMHTSTGDVSTTVDNLDPISLYAFRVNYETATAKVFSARDAYVWPESTHPRQSNFPEQIATYPYFGHHPGRHLNYIICEGDWTVTGTEAITLQTEWEALINAAFSTWQNATKGWVTASEHPTITDCADSTISTFIQDDDERSEIRVFKIPNDTVIFSFPEMRSDPLKVCLNDTGVDACVTSFSGYLGDDTFRQSDREEARRLLEVKRRNNGWTDNEEDKFLNLLVRSKFDHTVSARTALKGVDITFRGPTIESLDTQNRLRVPTTRFGRCPQRTPTSNQPEPDNPDYEYEGHRLVLHETLHAFGLTGFRPNDLIDFKKLLYEETHAVIPDSVLNYDRNIHGAYPEVTATYMEPDCAPHPFDVMALFALYQNVAR